MKPRVIFEKMNKTDKSLTRLIKKKGERTQINKIGNERVEVITDSTEIEGIIRKHGDKVFPQAPNTGANSP